MSLEVVNPPNLRLGDDVVGIQLKHSLKRLGSGDILFLCYVDKPNSLMRFDVFIVCLENTKIKFQRERCCLWIQFQLAVS